VWSVLHAKEQPAVDLSPLNKLAGQLRLLPGVKGKTPVALYLSARALPNPPPRVVKCGVCVLPQLAVHGNGRTVCLVDGVLDGELTTSLAWDLTTRRPRHMYCSPLRDAHTMLGVRRDWSVGTVDLFPWTPEYGVDVLMRVRHRVCLDTLRAVFNDAGSCTVRELEEWRPVIEGDC